jgi:protein-disulfide isomerase
VPKESYFPMIEIFFKTQAAWLENWPEGLSSIARQAGFTQEAFDKMLKDKVLAQGIIDVRDKAATFGIESIPTFFLNGEKLNGEVTIETLRAKIDPLLG